MILLFDYQNNHFKFLYMIKKHIDNNFIVIHEFNKNIFDKADVIIPISIESEIKLFEIGYKYINIRRKCLVVPEDLYYTLDNKDLFYEMVEKNNLLKNTNIKLIPSYNYEYIKSKRINKNGKYLLKNKMECGTKGNITRTGYIYDIIKEYSNEFQIQDIIDVKYISGYNIVCNYGEIVNTLNFVTPNSISENYYYKNNKQYLYPINKNQFNVVKNIVEYTKYSGFAEIEFIIDKNNNYYLLECNPRISGNLMCMITNSLSFNKNNICPYYDNLILAYINTLLNKPSKYKEYKNIVNITYFSNLI